MVVKGEVANRPSDVAGERAVANALMVVNNKDKNPVNRLNIIPDEIELYPGSRYQFRVDMQDANYLPAEVQVDSVKWYCPPDLGLIDAGGMFLANPSLISGYLYVQEGTMIDSAKITILDSLMTPSN